MVTQQGELPFYDGIVGLGKSYDAFAGRKDLRELFASLTWGRQGGERRDYILVLEGKTSFGKSSMRDWCLGEVTKAPDGEVVVCSLDCSLDLKFDFSERQSVRETFYKALFDKTYETFAVSVKEKTWGWKLGRMKRAFKKFVKKMSEGPEHAWNIVRGYKFAPLTSESYFEFIKDLNETAKSKPTAYVLIIDNVSHMQSGIQLCANFLMDFHIYSEAEKWPAKFPNFVLVLLPLPGWDQVKTDAAEDGKTYNDIGIERRITHRGGGKWEKLEALSQIEINEFVQRRCKKTGWKYDEKTFIPALYHASGGVPLLMQQIGVKACSACKERDSDCLTAKDVIAAIRATDLEKHVENTIRSALGYKAEEYLETVEDKKILPLFYKCQPIERIDWGKAIPRAVKGMTKKEWSDAVLAIPGKSTDLMKSFEKLWEGLVRHGVLVQKDGKYRFHAEVIRRYFNSFDTQ